MAILFPVPAATFADTLKVQSVTWRLREFTEMSGTAIGQVITATMAPAKWSADVALAPSYHRDANRVAALCEAIGAAGSFMLSNPMAQYPADDPDGTTLGASNVRIDALGNDNKTLGLKGLPSLYWLRAGDMAQVSSGAFRMLLRVSEDVQASAGGVTPLFEVRPHLRTWIALNQTVTLAKPAAKMMFAPGSFEPGTGAPLITSGAGFQAIEVY